VDLVWPFALLAVVLLGLNVVPRMQARRRRAALQAGNAATFRVRLAGTATPYPQAPRRGVLRVNADELTWTARGHGPVLDLTASGLRPTGLREPRSGDGGGQNESVLTAADAVGIAVRLVGLDGTLQNLHEVLSTRAAPVHPGPPRVVHAGRTRGAGLLLPAGLLLLALAGGAFTTWTLATGARVTATVISEEDADAYCKVRWTDPRDGSEHINGIDCYDDVGEQVTLVALAEPLRGEVVASDDPWFWAAVSAVVAVIALGWGARRMRSGRREQAAPAVAGVPVERPAALDESQLSYPKVAATMRARAAAEGWRFASDSAQPGGGSWILASPHRAFVLAVALSLWPLVMATFFAALTGWTSLAGMWSSTGKTARATATITDPEPYEMLPFGPADLEVRFPAGDGVSETTLVSVLGLPEQVPETIEVEYSVANPDRARATEYDGAAVGSVLSAVILLAGLAWAGWRLWQVLAGRRDQRQALRQAKHSMRYVLVPTGDGSCLMLLYTDGLVARPAFAVELADDLCGRMQGEGAVEVHGRLEASQVVVAKVDERDVLTASPLLDVDASDCVHLINGTEPAVA